MKGSPEEPWYVVKKDLERNVLVVAQGNNHPALFKKSLVVKTIDWVDGKGPELPYKCHAKNRYRQADQACELTREGEYFIVNFEEPQRAVTPGQSVVFYQGDICLGGGIIESMSNAH